MSIMKNIFFFLKNDLKLCKNVNIFPEIFSVLLLVELPPSINFYIYTRNLYVTGILTESCTLLCCLL